MDPLKTVIEGPGAETGLGGAAGLALGTMVLVLALGFVPDQTSFTAIKAVLFLSFPLVALAVAPVRLGGAMASELSGASGWLVLALLGWVGFLELQALEGPRGEQLAFLAAGWVLLVFMRSLREVELDRVLRVAVTMALVGVGGAALVQVFPVEGLEVLRFPMPELPVGTLGNRSDLAYFMALGLPEAVTLLAGEGLLGGLLGGLAGALGLGCLVLARSRGAWLALVGAGLARLLLPAAPSHDRVLARRLLGLLLVAALVPLAVWRFQGGLGGLFGPGKRATLETRVFTWERTLEGIRQGGWVGHGPGSFPRLFPRLKEAHLRQVPDAAFVAEARRARVTRQAHNEALELTLEWGGVGAALLALLGLAWILGALSGLSRTPRPGHRRRRRLGLAILVAGALACGFHFPLQLPPLALLLLAALARASGPLPERDGGSPLGLALALVLALGAGGAAWRLGGAEGCMQRGLLALQAGRDGEAAAAFQEALDRRPSARAWNSLGRLYISRGRAAEAAEAFARAEALEPSYGHAQNLGVAALTRGEGQEAGEAFLRAWFRQPEQETGFYLGAFLEHRGEPDQAEAVYRRARELTGYSGRPGYALGRLLWSRGRRAEAAEVLRQEVALAAGALEAGGGGALARVVRMRLACMRLLEKVLTESHDPEGAARVAAALSAWQPGLDLDTLGPVGAREGIL